MSVVMGVGFINWREAGRSHLAHWPGGGVRYVMQTDQIAQQTGISKIHFGRFDQALADICMVGAQENLEPGQVIQIAQVADIAL